MNDRRRESETTLVGAGLAGSLLAIYLARRGQRVTIYEKRSDLRDVEVAAGRSINLALAARGIAALKQVGVMPLIEPLLIPMSGRMLHDESGTLQFLPYGNKPEEVIYSVSRGGLNGILMDAAEATGLVTIRFEHNCLRVDLDKMELEILKNGRKRPRRIEFDRVVGTDGSASAVRESIIAAVGGDMQQEELGHGYKELSIEPGPNGTFKLEKNALHIWPRGEFMLIALPNIDGSFTVTLFLPNSGPESFAALSTGPAIDGFFGRRFPDVLPLLTRLHEEFESNPTGHLETVRCWPWYGRDRALILGDAAHAIVPFHGQGMNCAFEDCLVLDAAIEGGDGDWNKIFADFAHERKPNADAISDMALENYVEMRSTVRDPRFQLKKQVAFRLEEMFPTRFIPRYSMVMFHLLPYAEAKRRGALQAEILDELVSGRQRLDEIDFQKAAAMVTTSLPPFSSEGLPTS
ncbi:MAG: NAD(P)/FAD-dependent oxidoreductase [Acidobacteriota bacterium]